MSFCQDGNERFVAASASVLNIIENELSDILDNNFIPNSQSSSRSATKSDENHSRKASSTLTVSSCSNFEEIGEPVLRENIVLPSDECFQGSEDENEHTSEKFYIHQMAMMKQLLDDRRKRLEVEKNTYVKNLFDASCGVTGTAAIGIKLHKIETLNQHLLKILEEAELIKDKLQNPVLHNVLNVKVHYHRFVLEFFELSTALINELAENKQSIDWLSNHNLWDCFSMEPLVTDTCKNVVELKNSLDLLSEFRLNLQALVSSIKGENANHDPENDIDVLIKI